MLTATASWIEPPGIPGTFVPTAIDTQCAEEYVGPEPGTVSWLGVELPFPIQAPWLGRVERRLDNSARQVRGDEADASDSLEPAVVLAAKKCLASTSDLLPCEPYLTTSLSGALVAEFRGKWGSLTIVVGATFVLLFSAVEGAIAQAKYDVADVDYSLLRKDLREIKKKVDGAGYGNLGTRSR